MLINLAVSILAGILLAAAFPLSFAPDAPQWAWPWLAFFAPVLLFVALRRAKSALEAYLLGFIAGGVLHLLGVYWISSFGAPALVSLVIYQAFIFGFLGIALHIVLRFQSDSYNYVLLPAVWVAFEYLHSIGAASFPWLHLGYTQYENAPVLQLAGYGGVYASSFFVLLAAYSVFHLFWGRSPMRLRLKSTAFAALALLVLYLGGCYTYWAWNRAEKLMPATTIAVVQGGLASNEPWNLDEYVTAAHQAYVGTTLNLLQRRLQHRPELVVWPEGALPTFYNLHGLQLDPDVRNLWTQREDLKLLMASLLRTDKGLENAALLFTGPNTLAGKYSKNHLVGFGEFVPFGKALRMLDYPWGAEDLHEGESLDPVPFNESSVAVNICYDSVYPSVTREQVRRGATLISVLANNSWYKLPSGAGQHAVFDFFRAVENRRTLVRAATTGISGFIAPSGRQIAAIARNKCAWLTEQVPVNRAVSLYTLWGDTFAIVMLIIAVTGVAYRAFVGVGEDIF